LLRKFITNICRKGANMKTRRKFTREIKKSILGEIENGKSAECRENGVHSSIVYVTPEDFEKSNERF
jgi:transposase-like protein